MKNTIALVALLFAGPVLAEDEPPPDAASEARIQKLVEQLGDARYPVREGAQKALLKEGESILPILDKLGPVTDPEVRRRLDRIRKALSRCQLVVTWDPTATRTPLINAPPGPQPFFLSGRVQVIQSRRVSDAELGKLTVDMYLPGEEGPIRREVWEIGKETLPKLAKRDGNALSFTLMLPLTSHQPDPHVMPILRVCYQPLHGAAVEDRQQRMLVPPGGMQGRGAPIPV